MNAQMLDGTTPLMLAVRLAIEGIAEDLINADANVDDVDEFGSCYFIDK